MKQKITKLLFVAMTTSFITITGYTQSSVDSLTAENYKLAKDSVVWERPFNYFAGAGGSFMFGELYTSCSFFAGRLGNRALKSSKMVLAPGTFILAAPFR